MTVDDTTSVTDGIGNGQQKGILENGNLSRRGLMKVGGVAGLVGLMGTPGIAAGQEGDVHTGMMYSSPDQEHPGGGEWKGIAFDSVWFDVAEDFDPENNQLVAPSDGYYVLCFGVEGDAVIDQKRHVGEITVNGEGVARDNQVGSGSEGEEGTVTTDISSVTYTIQELSEGDTVKARLYSDHPESYVIDGAREKTFLSFAKLDSVSGAAKLHGGSDEPQAVPGDESWNQVNAQTMDFAQSESVVNADESKYVAPSDGLYVLGFASEINAPGNKNRVVGGIMRNGNGQDSLVSADNQVGYGGETPISTTALTATTLSEGDEITASIWQNSGSEMTLDQGRHKTFLYAARVGDPSNRPYLRAVNSEAYSMTTPNNWNTASFDSSVESTAGAALESNFIVAPEEGYYLVGFNTKVNGVPDNKRAIGALNLNGSRIARNNMVGSGGSGENGMSCGINTIEWLQAGDRIGSYIWMNASEVEVAAGDASTFMYIAQVAGGTPGGGATPTPTEGGGDATPTPTEGGGDETPTPTEGGGDETPTPTDEGMGGMTPTETDTETPGSPGLGFGAALLGAAGAGWRALRRRRNDE